MFPRDPGRSEPLHEATRGVFAPVIPPSVLVAGEDPGVKAHQGKPLGASRRPSKGLHGGRPVFQVRHRRRGRDSWLERLRDGHSPNLAGVAAITPSEPQWWSAGWRAPLALPALAGRPPAMRPETAHP